MKDNQGRASARKARLVYVQVFEEDIARPQRVRDFTSQALSNMVWSFATLRWYPEKVLEAVSAELHRRNNRLTVQVNFFSTAHMSKPQLDIHVASGLGV